MSPTNEKLQEARKQAAVGIDVARRETAVTAKECAAQAQRLLAYGQGAYQARKLNQQLQAAIQTFGQRLYAAGLGEAVLRKQIETVDQRRQQAQAAKEKTRLLDDERRGLFIRLAEPYLLAAPVRELEAELQQIAALRTQLAELGQAQAHQRAGLLPVDRGSRLRVAAGFAAVALLLVGGAWLLFGGKDAGNVVQQPTPIAPTDGDRVELGLPTPQPVSTDSPKVDTAKPVVKEHQADEDNYFPRRRVEATYVNDQADGECKCYDDKDRLIAVEYYRQGKLHGKRTSYYPSGKKFCELQFVDGKATGSSTIWFENGQVAEVTEFSGGTLHGKFVSYFENGNKFVECENVNGAAHGERLHFLPNGTCFGASFWENGRQTGQQTVLDVSQSQFNTIDQRSKFSTFLKDHWR